MRRISTIMIAAAWAVQAAPVSAEDVIRAAVLRVDQVNLPPISRLDAMPDDLGFAGAELATQDNATTGQFMGQDFETETIATDEDGATDALEQILASGTRFVAVVADDATMLQLADHAAQVAPEALLFNAASGGDHLRNEDCRANVIHIAPSRAMLTDALAQFLIWKRWDRWFLIHGSHEGDHALRDAYIRAAGKFNARIVETREFEDTGGSRRTDSGHVQVQAQLPVFTQNVRDHHVTVTADENGVFAAYMPYQTWDARPVAGSAGLGPRAFHPALEAWGATQFQNRFERLANRPIRDVDYNVWLSLRALGEAATRAGSTDPEALRDYITGPEFQIAGFKGEALSLRDWDHQLRQPILLATPHLVASVSPQEGFLHQVSQLDTLGTDRAESTCQF
ncbi:MAG: ABC transporter substrate-binding protein [Paracoccus sp. (in: a-proteobacteria)]|nr:ABC transporter substrate-binding protein [Paracoccus sp. (in: a-proteobacteria)]